MGRSKKVLTPEDIEQRKQRLRELKRESYHRVRETMTDEKLAAVRARKKAWYEAHRDSEIERTTRYYQKRKAELAKLKDEVQTPVEVSA